MTRSGSSICTKWPDSVATWKVQGWLGLLDQSLAFGTIDSAGLRTANRAWNSRVCRGGPGPLCARAPEEAPLILLTVALGGAWWVPSFLVALGPPLGCRLLPSRAQLEMG